MTETNFYKQLELQKKFDVDTNISKVMDKYCCESCRIISKNLEVHKESFKKEIYEKIENLQKIVDEHNKTIDNCNKKVKNKTLMQKLGLESVIKDEKWLVSYNMKYGDIYIREECHVVNIINDIPHVNSPGFRRCYVICPVCNYKHSFMNRKEY